MPVKILRAHLKPAGFFDVKEILSLQDTLTGQRNPGLDVPVSVDSKSKLATEARTSSTGRQAVSSVAEAIGNCKIFSI
jgi:hypothetical protein